MPEQIQKLEKFGRWSVIEKLTPSNYLCQCECGKTKKIKKYTLVSGASKSCGLGKCRSARFHTHKLSASGEYECWQGIKRRIFKKNRGDYKHYGGRGIKMHEAWVNDFKAFYEHVGPRPSSKHSLDRINNNGNYEPGNVRWVTIAEQAKNRRPAHNAKFYNFNGQLVNLTTLAELTKIPRKILKDRVQKNNWSIKCATAESAVPFQGEELSKICGCAKHKHPNGKPKRVYKGKKPGSAPKLYEFRGEMMDLEKISKITGINRNTLRTRIYMYDWSIEKATSVPVQHGKFKTSTLLPE